MEERTLQWPIKLDRHEYGQIIIDQFRGGEPLERIIPNRVILTEAQVEELCRFTREKSR